MTRLVLFVAATLTAVITLTTGLTLLASGSTHGCLTSAAAPSASTPTWDADQLANAATIVAVGARLGVPARGQVVALATAIQESSLRNLPSGDRDSVGLFQQRPSTGWGTAAQLRDPVFAAHRFYRALLAVHGWLAMPLTQAAQTVQRSAYPTAYAARESAAVQLFARISGPAAARNTQRAGCTPDVVNPADIAAPVTMSNGPSRDIATSPAVKLALGWAMAQLGTPYSYGGDCTASRSGVATHECDCASLVILS
jgi:hypothetical protein